MQCMLCMPIINNAASPYRAPCKSQLMYHDIYSEEVGVTKLLVIDDNRCILAYILTVMIFNVIGMFACNVSCVPDFYIYA